MLRAIIIYRKEIMKECFECGKEATEDHHVIPESLGGVNTVPLCSSCHNLVHGDYHIRRDDHRELTMAGLQRARERGVIFGNRTNLSEASKIGGETMALKANSFALFIYDNYLKDMKEAGLTYEQMAKELIRLQVSSSRGGLWCTSSVHCTMKRAKKLLKDVDNSVLPL